jgi:hypothetical protein
LKLARNNRLIIVVGLLFSIIFLSCGKEQKVERSNLVKIFVETTIAQERYSHSPDSLKLAKLAIFEKYNISSDEYEKAINNSEMSAIYWDAFFKEVRVYLDSLKTVSNQQVIPSLK